MIHKRVLRKWQPTGLLLGLILPLLWACDPTSEIITKDPNTRLLFSQDTVLFDTLFTSVGSTTRRLKMLNFSENAVVLSNISLAGGEDSPFRLFVNGERGSSFESEFVRGGDSLLMLVEVTVDPQDESMPFLVRDSILFEWNGQQAHVKLLAWGQDAVFVGNVRLACNTTWTSRKPYVLFDDVLVDSACSLTIQKGTRIYANRGASLFVGGEIHVEGDSTYPVVFQHSRQEPEFENVPGQWGGIFFLPSSQGSSIEYAQIRNATNGIYVGIPDDNEEPDVIIGHTLIENMSQSCLLAFTSDVYAYNCQFGKSIQPVVGNLAGGNYQYDHCTFANFRDYSREFPTALFADNVILANKQTIVAPLRVQLNNSIIWGSEEKEFLLDNGGGASFSVTAASSMFKGTEGSISGSNNFFNVNPAFVDESQYDLRIDLLSPAKNRGIDLGIVDDLHGLPRSLPVDIGAHEQQN